MTLRAAPPRPFKTVPAVRQAFAVLRFVAESASPVGVNAIARGANLGASTCFNILKTLAVEGCVAFDEGTKSYSLGPGLVTLARKALDPAGIIDAVRPILENLSRSEGVTASLWQVTPDDRMALLTFVETGQGTRIHLEVGQRLPLLIGAGGRCVAAELNLPRQVLKQRFDSLRWQSPPRFEAYLRDLAATRSRGWAVDNGNYVRGVTSLAAAIRNDAGVVRYCVTSTLFQGETDAALAKIGSATVLSAKRVQRLLHDPIGLSS